MGDRELTAGTVLGGDYVVEARLAAGGMGTVYACRQRSTGERRAVKVLSAEVLVDEDLGRRFELECRASGRIRSEHVVKVLAAGVESNRHPWIAMEFLEGETLAARVARDGPLDRGTARLLFAQVGHALSAAHAAQFAHRDLKPENIFIARSLRADVALTVKVLDFGIAKVRDALSAKTTMAGLGTPLWMAPEQFTPGASWRAADVWALGLLAFYVLTGRIYWRGAATPTHLASEVFQPSYAPASDRARELLGRDPLPAGFDPWFARCVALSPDARFATIDEAVASLDALLAQPSVAPTQAVAHRPPPVRPARKRWGRALIAAVVVAAVALTGVFVSGPSSAPSTDPTAPSPPASPSIECPADMAAIPGGRVRLLDGNSYGVPPYCLERTEVRVADYARCVAARRCEAVTASIHSGELPNVCNARLPGHEDHPINCVTFARAEQYCRWRGRRLPSEREWELAATGDGRAWPWGDEPGGALRMNACGLECTERPPAVRAYVERDDFPATAPVGRFRAGATPEGVLDLAGNVSEWVLADTAAPVGEMLLRGSNFMNAPTPNATARNFEQPGHEGRTIGFRCAK